MLPPKSFYKLSTMPPYMKSKRVSSPADTSPPKRRKTAQRLKVEVETPEEQSPRGLRRSPRITKKAKVLLTALPTQKENVDVEEKEEFEDVKPLTDVAEDEEEEESSFPIGMSDYERKRLENISQNAKFFASLEIFQAKDSLAALSPQAQKPKPVHRGLKREKREAAPLPRRAPSLRLQNKAPDGQQLPDSFKEPRFTPSFYEPPEPVGRKPSGPLKMVATNVKKVEKSDQGADFVESVSRLAKGFKSDVKVETDDLDRFTKRLQKMKMKEEQVAKVVPDRIFSVAVHPSHEKTLVCAGDKWGKIGLWDVKSKEGDDGVFLFNPHTRPINCLQFAPTNPNKLYSVSYDGTVRCGDFDKAVFDEVYAGDDDEYLWTTSFDFLSKDGSSLIVAQNQRQGYVVVVDTRSSGSKPESLYWVHGKGTKCVSVHPTMPSYFVTASKDSTVALWDIRKMKVKGMNQPITSMPHNRSVNSAYFSPITGSRILTTSMDDKISVFELETGKEDKLMGTKQTLGQRHNNYTGRWLTPFRAIWHPRREDAYVVGSMSQPRRIEVFSTQGKIVHEFFNEYLGSVCSLNAFHPTRDVVVGGNSSGKLHVFMS